MKKANCIIYRNVAIGKNASIGDFIILGAPPVNSRGGELETIIGDNAILRSHSVIYAGNRIGNNFQSGHNAVIREVNLIGDDVSIGTSSIVEHHCKIGDKVRIHSQAFICEYSILEEGCWIGPHAALANTLHPLCPQAKKCLKGPVIKRNAKIGANATILPGVVIGENSLIGAGSTVVKDIPKNTVAAGNPARVIKEIGSLKCRYGLIGAPYRAEEG